LEAQTAVPAWSFAVDLGRSAASWVPSSLEQNSTQHTLTGRIKKIQRRLWDLLPVIRNHVYDPAFAGSYSLKDVLPALVPDMTYEGMEVANGTDAGLAWESLIRGGLDQVERDKIKKALLDYCGQDTLALVRLLERLRARVIYSFS
jgi:predicted RecB family nuclease